MFLLYNRKQICSTNHLTFRRTERIMMFMTNQTTKPMPTALYAAWEWTDAAGELPELASLSGAELDSYVTESAANAIEHDVTDVHADDLRELAAWLADQSASRRTQP